MSTIIIRLAILLTGFTIIAGCKPAHSSGYYPTETEWDIVMTSPGGQITTYTVKSYARPQPYYRASGFTEVRDWGNPGVHDWERDIVAPTGWRLEVKPHQGSTNEKAEIDY